MSKRKLDEDKDDRSAKIRKVKDISEDSSEDVYPVDWYTHPLPKRDKAGYLRFPDHPDFRPNLTPKEKCVRSWQQHNTPTRRMVHSTKMQGIQHHAREKTTCLSILNQRTPEEVEQDVLHRGSFGGTYFRNITSGVLKKKLKGKDAIDELPKEWFKGLNLKKQVCSQVYDPTVNKYGVRCGGGLQMWEGSGWIAAQDPYGWFEWYCHFYLGRRTDDDDRQVARGKGVIGPKGRWRNNLIGKIARAGRAYDDYSVSPVIRQALQHWGYVLTQKDAEKYVKLKKLPPLPDPLGTDPNSRHHPPKRQGLWNPNTMKRIKK